MRRYLLFTLTSLIVCVAGGYAMAAETISPQEMATVKAAEQARINVVNQVYDSVVAVYGANPASGGGSGVLIHPDGFAVTNFHVVNGVKSDAGKAGLADGRMYNWQLIGIDPGGDLAIIQLKGHRDGKFPFAKLGDSDKVHVGDTTIAMGNPFVLAEDQKPTVTFGIVSGLGRFQAGQGGPNMLVYGGCIQIDTSINPGNSGGPLFNMAGRVIGINGRGSFDERVRINVGVGYAISSEQVKTFIPDLMAAKHCMHGTLEATFTERQSDGKVVCDKIDPHGVMAREKMDTSDELISFNGTPIYSTNQFINLISMLPGGWPVEVVWRQPYSGKVFHSWVRLTPLPAQPQMVKKPTTQPTTRPAPMEKPGVEPGGILKMNINRENAAGVLVNWQRFRGSPQNKDIKAIRFVEDVYREGEKIGACTTVWTIDGKEIIEQSDKAVDVFLTTNGLAPKAKEQDKNHPFDSFRGFIVKTLTGMIDSKALTYLKLQGSDKALSERAWRLWVEPVEGQRTVLWFSLLRGRNEFETRLLKVSGCNIDGEEDLLAMTFSDYRLLDGAMFPHKRQYVMGISEKIVMEMVATKIELLTQAP